MEDVAHTGFDKGYLLVIIGDLAWEAFEIVFAAKEYGVYTHLLVNKLFCVNVVIMGDAHSFAPESYK